MAIVSSLAADFRVIATLDVGKNPHQIQFDASGRMAYVAAAGSDQITLLDEW